MHLSGHYFCNISKDGCIKLTLLFFLLFLYKIDSAQSAFPDSIVVLEQKIISDSVVSIPTTEHFSATTIQQSSDTLLEQKETSISKKIKKQKKVDTTHYSPKKAAIWGASFPGLGQIYMKKYWKLPIVYGVLSATLYFVVSNGKNLKTYNGYLRNMYNNVTNPSPIDQLSLAQVEAYRNTYRRNVQLASFATVFAWGLSIVDAVVDAHLHAFDISDNLSLKVKPDINYSNFTYYAGIGVHLNLK